MILDDLVLGGREFSRENVNQLARVNFFSCVVIEVPYNLVSYLKITASPYLVAS